MTPDERWLSAVWPFVRAQISSPPGRVLEVGCGPLGGFVPNLRSSGYDAVGVDPEAPQAPGYHRTEFQHYHPSQSVDAVIACTSLHHVDDLATVLDRIASALVIGGVLVVVEWAWELFDEPTAHWCFARLPDEPGWLHARRDEWLVSGQLWDAYCQTWAQREGLHTGERMLRELDARFARQLCAYGPYFCSDLASTTEEEEQDAVDREHIRATRFNYVGRRRLS